MADQKRALRRMIAELAEMHPADATAVLDQLSDAQRDRVRALLEEYGGPTPAAVPAELDRAGLPSNLSAWLLEKLGIPTAASPHGEGSRTITPSAAAALKACAAELSPAPRLTADQPVSRLATVADRLRPAGWKLRR